MAFIFSSLEVNTEIHHSLGHNLYMCVSGGLAAFRRFSGFYDRPSKEICKSFENRNEHTHNAKMTRGNRIATLPFKFKSCLRFDNLLFSVRNI